MTQPAQITKYTELRENIVRAIKRARDISTHIADAPNMSKYVTELKSVSSYVDALLSIASTITGDEQVLYDETYLFLANKTASLIRDLNGVLLLYFKSGQRSQQEAEQEDNIETKETEQDTQGGEIEVDIDALFGDAVSKLDNETRGRIAIAVKEAINKVQHRKKNVRGNKVKRISCYPSWDIEPNTGVVYRRRLIRDSSQLNAKSALQAFSKLPPNKRIKTNISNILSTIEYLEGLLGKYTVKKVSAIRKLHLLEKALDEANQELMARSVGSLMQGSGDCLREMLDEACKTID